MKWLMCTVVLPVFTYEVEVCNSLIILSFAKDRHQIQPGESYFFPMCALNRILDTEKPV